MEEQFEVMHIENRLQVAFGEERHIDRGTTKISSEDVEVSETIIVEKSDEKEEKNKEPEQKKSRFNRKRKYIEKEVFLPANADPDRTHLNRELIERPVKENEDGIKVPLTISQTIKRRIEKATGKKVIPKDTNIALEIIFTGSHDTMVAMDLDTLENWCNDTIQWARDTFGEENVVSAVLHRDERTPHIHMFVVPITSGPSRSTLRKRYTRKLKCEEEGKPYREYKTKEKLRLCADDFGGTEAYLYYHDTYSKVVEKYGLERGVKAEKGSKKKHLTSEEYNRELAKKAKELEEIIKEQGEFMQEQEELIQEQESQIQQLKSDIASVKSDLSYGMSLNKKLSERNARLDEDYHDKIDRYEGIMTQQTDKDMQTISTDKLKVIVKNELNGELQNFSQETNGDYRLNVLQAGKPFVLRVEKETGNVSVLEANKWVLHPKLNGKPFLNFFQAIRNPALYSDLEKAIDKRLAVQKKVSAGNSAPSQVNRGGGGGPKDDRKPVNLGRGGSVPTAGASSSAGKGESLYDELVRKGDEDSRKNKGPKL